MKGKLLLLIFAIALAFTCQAEYQGWYIKFKMETLGGEPIIGYTYVAMAYFEKDSAASSNYLIKKFAVLDHKQKEVIHYHKDFLTYNYKLFEDENKIYGMLNPDSIPTTQVKNIEVLKMIQFGYLEGIGSSHTLADTTWMKKPANENLILDGYLCSWLVFIHEATENTNLVKQKLKTIETKYKAKIKPIETDMSYPEGDHDALEEQLEALQQQKEKAYREILKFFKDDKVVIINSCSC